jgi:prepilin-type N-terminal cleavage/methylation domain-containing protein
MKARGFTLIEVVLALAIAAAVLVIAFGGLRVGLAAWWRGEARAARMDHARGVLALVERALDGVFPYRHVPSAQRDARVLFEGRADRVTFSTVTPPFPDAAPVAFTAVTLSSEPAGLVLRQLPLPNVLAFERVPPALVDGETTALRFRYRGEEGAWQDEWDMTREDALPRAVEVTLRGRDAAAGERVLTVALRAARP